MSVEIPPQFASFVQQSIASGRFESESAMLGEALRLLREQEELRQAVQNGFDQIERGECSELANDEELHQFFEDLIREASAKLQSREKVQ